MLEQVSGLLFPTEKLAQRPRISYQIVEGSVRHKFRTLMQTVIGFGAVLTQISSQLGNDEDRESAAGGRDRLTMP